MTINQTKPVFISGQELHYQLDHDQEYDKRRAKHDKMSVGLFNPIKFLNSIDQWRIDKFETEIWIEMWHVSLVPYPLCDTWCLMTHVYSESYSQETLVSEY